MPRAKTSPRTRLQADDACPPTPRLRNERVVLVVHAPFGADEELSTFPDNSSMLVTQHPLVRNLIGVARSGVHVCALIDRVDDDSMLLEVQGGRPASARLTSCWKQDMASPRSLAGLLRRAHACHPEATIVLALEGHGAGYLPEIDRRHITHANLTRAFDPPNNDQGGTKGPVRWEINPLPHPDPKDGTPPLPMGAPILPMGAPILPMGAPILPMGAPILPSSQMPMSTWGLGEALRLARTAGVPRIAVVHLSNCFNMSTELLHTLMPHADYATGYSNYNFFTAGQTYPGLFAGLRSAGSYTAEDLARGFALGNRDLLEAKRNHPTVGGMVQLARMEEVAKGVDALAGALVDALKTAADGAPRRDMVDRIRRAIVRTQVFDTDGTFTLEMPDQMTDLMSLAAHLQDGDLALGAAITSAASTLQLALARVKQYGSNDRPWLVEPPTAVRWDFSAPDLAMNILLPDPDLRGLYDWRAPFYLNINAETDPTPRVQPHVIEFLKATDWVDFIKEYHRDVDFKGLLPAVIPRFPVFKARYDPEGGGGPNDPKGPKTPKGTDGRPRPKKR